MPLSPNEIKERAAAFAHKWAGEDSERAEAQSFWNDFFNVFGVDRKRVAVFEKQVLLARAGEAARQTWNLSGEPCHGRADQQIQKPPDCVLAAYRRRQAACPDLERPSCRDCAGGNESARGRPFH